MATVLERNGKTMRLIPCKKIIGGKVKNFHIEGTERYFVAESAAIKRMRILLMEQALPENEFAIKMEVKRRMIIARRVIRTNNCWREAITFVQRWEGIISLENKKRLCEDLQSQIKEECKLGKFKNAASAIVFEYRNNPKNRKTR